MGTLDKTGLALDSMKGMKVTLAENMENLIARDDKLDEMINKTEAMGELSYSLNRKAKKVHSNAFWSSIAAKIMYVVIGLVSGGLSDTGVCYYDLLLRGVCPREVQVIPS